MSTHFRWSSAAALAVSALLGTSTAADVIYETVALTGMPAPGAPAGANFNTFSGAPVLNPSGQTSFRAFLQTTGGGVTSSNDEGLWSEGPGTLSLVAREGSQAPGTPAGANFGTFINPPMNPSGQTAFRAILQTTGGGVTTDNDQGIWSEGSGSLALVAREGSQAPGTPAGANFSIFTNPVLNASGQTAFRAFLQTTGGGVTASNDEGIWSEGSGSLVLVAREGSQAPGTPVGANFSGLGLPVLNGSGRIAFIGGLQSGSGGVTSTNDSGIWSQGSGTLTLIARKGNQAPGTPAGANFSTLGSPAFNNSGRTAFSASLQTGAGGVNTSNDSGIWSEGSGSLALVAREGSQAPGTPSGAIFFTFDTPILNTNSRTAFIASVTGSGGGVTGFNDTGIWSEGTGSLSLVVREGSQAPGTPAGAIFSDFSFPSMNASGRTAFQGTLYLTGGGINNGNDRGIWAEDPLGVLTLVIREGDLFEVSPGDFRTIASLSFASGLGGEDGGGMSFNDDFTLAFRAMFTDGSQGIFTATVPEPATLALLSLGGVALLRRWR